MPRPHATDDKAYTFERPVSFRHGDGSESPGRIDCYRRGAFVLESKKLHPGALAASPGPLGEAALADRFTGRGPWKKRLPQILQTLEALGRARADAGASGAVWRAA